MAPVPRLGDRRAGTFAALLGATGPHLVSLHNASGLIGCQGVVNCQPLADNFLLQLYRSYGVLYSLAVAARSGGWSRWPGGRSPSPW